MYTLVWPILVFSCSTIGAMLRPSGFEATTDPLSTPTTESDINASVVVRQGRLVFETVEDYESFVDNPSERQKAEFISRVKGLPEFTPFAMWQSSHLAQAKWPVDDEFFASILNSDLAVQIGPYIVRVNPWTETAFTLPVANEMEYSDLIAERTDNEHIRWFSPDEDLLGLIQDGSLASLRPQPVRGAGGSRQSWFGCMEDSTGERTDCDAWVWTKATGSTSNTRYMLGEVRYRKYVIYFHLWAEVWISHSTSSCSSPATTYTTDTVGIRAEPYHYKPRCKPAAGPTNNYGSSGDGHHKFDAYSGGKALSKYHLRTQFDCDGYFSDWLEIRVNY